MNGWTGLSDDFDDNAKVMSLSGDAVKLWVSSWSYTRRNRRGREPGVLTHFEAVRLCAKLSLNGKRVISELLAIPEGCTSPAWDTLVDGEIYRIHDVEQGHPRTSADRMREKRKREAEEASREATEGVTGDTDPSSQSDGMDDDVTSQGITSSSRSDALVDVPVTVRDAGAVTLTRALGKPTPTPSPIPPPRENNSETLVSPRPRSNDLSASRASPTGPPGQIEQVFEAWRGAVGATGRTVLDGRRRRLIERGLQTHGLEDCLDAVRGVALSSWHMGLNDRRRPFNGLDLVLRDAQHVEYFRDILRGLIEPPADLRGDAYTAALLDQADRLEAQEATWHD